MIDNIIVIVNSDSSEILGRATARSRVIPQSAGTVLANSTVKLLRRPVVTLDDTVSNYVSSEIVNCAAAQNIVNLVGMNSVKNNESTGSALAHLVVKPL